MQNGLSLKTDATTITKILQGYVNHDYAEMQIHNDRS